MKPRKNSLVSKAALVLISALIITTAASAQIVETQNPNVKPNAIANLIAGISSENDGVRKCAIYFASKYEIDQTVDALIKQLKVEQIPSLRILISLALYKIGNEKGLNAIYDNASLENDPHVKNMFNAIVKEYYVNKGNIVSSVTEIQ